MLAVGSCFNFVKYPNSDILTEDNVLLFIVLFYFQILAAVIGHAVVKAQLATRPDMKNLRTGRVLVDIDNPETHQSQYHTADFDRSKCCNEIFFSLFFSLCFG